MRREQFQLLGFALLVEHLDAFQPPRPGRTVQLTQMAERPLTWTAGGPHRLYQRPLGMILTVLAALMRP